MSLKHQIFISFVNDSQNYYIIYLYFTITEIQSIGNLIIYSNYLITNPNDTHRDN